MTAFPTKHALESYGYRFDTPDRSIVISGNTNPTQRPLTPAAGATCWVFLDSPKCDVIPKFWEHHIFTFCL
ncbi:MAG TPA: hypothetical protein VEV42_12760, partial [Pyrinomonadaceae bacterium]|nr:hypothetical protein [Pyrinomonadaceae bacterium]